MVVKKEEAVRKVAGVMLRKQGYTTAVQSNDWAQSFPGIKDQAEVLVDALEAIGLIHFV